MPTSVRRNVRRSFELSNAEVRELADAMLRGLSLERCELSVLLTSDTHIQKLNREHRDKDRPTDVLAFPMDEPEMGLERCLGDVVISLDTALRQAHGRRRPLFAEVRFLLAHAVAHLLGHDHGTASEKRAMDRVSRKLVAFAASPLR